MNEMPSNPGRDSNSQEESAPEWDADDPRRRNDCFAPPARPCECHCLHCGRVFMSDQIWLQKAIGARDGFEGFWMCPTPNCGGAGFTFDIFPTDPDHPANADWFCSDDEDLELDEFDELDGEDFVSGFELDAGDDAGWDPQETKYRELDEMLCGFDDDIEGEEWKYGLAPGERPPVPATDDAQAERDAEERSYNEPDRRPREIDWTDSDQGAIRDDDIPF